MSTRVPVDGSPYTCPRPLDGWELEQHAASWKQLRGAEPIYYRCSGAYSDGSECDEFTVIPGSGTHQRYVHVGDGEVCGKRLMEEIGQDEDTGETQMWHVCWHCGYEERDRQWRVARVRTRPTSSRAAERLREMRMG